LGDKQDFHHGEVLWLSTPNGAAFAKENAARFASAMQLATEVASHGI
jgi:hypothetical protein